MKKIGPGSNPPSYRFFGLLHFEPISYTSRTQRKRFSNEPNTNSEISSHFEHEPNTNKINFKRAEYEQEFCTFKLGSFTPLSIVCILLATYVHVVVRVVEEKNLDLFIALVFSVKRQELKTNEIDRAIAALMFDRRDYRLPEFPSSHPFLKNKEAEAASGLGSCCY